MAQVTFLLLLTICCLQMCTYLLTYLLTLLTLSSKTKSDKRRRQHHRSAGEEMRAAQQEQLCALVNEVKSTRLRLAGWRGQIDALRRIGNVCASASSSTTSATTSSSDSGFPAAQNATARALLWARELDASGKLLLTLNGGGEHFSSSESARAGGGGSPMLCAATAAAHGIDRVLAVIPAVEDAKAWPLLWRSAALQQRAPPSRSLVRADTTLCLCTILNLNLSSPLNAKTTPERGRGNQTLQLAVRAAQLLEQAQHAAVVQSSSSSSSSISFSASPGTDPRRQRRALKLDCGDSVSDSGNTDSGSACSGSGSSARRTTQDAPPSVELRAVILAARQQQRTRLFRKSR